MSAIDPITAALNIGEKLIDKFFPNASDAAAAKLELLKMNQSGELAKLAAETDITKAQLAVNAVEAGSTDPFTSRARPFILWTCGTAMGYVAIVDPILRFVATVGFGYVGDFPVIDTTITLQVLLGLLGLSGMRSFDKVKGVA